MKTYTTKNTKYIVYETLKGAENKEGYIHSELWCDPQNGGVWIEVHGCYDEVEFKGKGFTLLGYNPQCFPATYNP